MTSSSPGQQAGRTIMLGTSRTPGTNTTGGVQKFVILQSRSQTPTATCTIQQSQQQQPSQTQQQQQSQQQQVKISQTNVVQQKAHLQSSGAKLVVVCMSNSTHTSTTTISQVCALF